jgi:lipopolysaccharide/colanic/teichoic acid biosynthesis glycosyltransferase
LLRSELRKSLVRGSQRLRRTVARGRAALFPPFESLTCFRCEYRQVTPGSLESDRMVLDNNLHRRALGNLAKRAFDVAVSAVLLPVYLPLLLVVALCIVLESGFPILYRQKRVGRDGRGFTLYRLRCVRNATERDGKVRWAKADDDRTTHVGRFIRKYRIDELPQIINVIKGEMTFVGSQPERPEFVNQLSKHIRSTG